MSFQTLQKSIFAFPVLTAVAIASMCSVATALPSGVSPIQQSSVSYDAIAYRSSGRIDTESSVAYRASGRFSPEQQQAYRGSERGVETLANQTFAEQAFTEQIIAYRASGRFQGEALISYRASGRFQNLEQAYRGSERGVETLGLIAYRASGRLSDQQFYRGSERGLESVVIG